MSALANEKERLSQELAAARRRHTEIQTRLAEIAEKERRLFAFIKGLPDGAAGVSDPVPDKPRRVKTREIRY